MSLYWRLSFKRLLAILVPCIIELVLLSNHATASPVPNVLRDLVKRYSGNIAQQEPIGGILGSPATSNFPTDTQIIAAWVPPTQNSYVFYTEINDPLGSQLAYNFAREIGGVTVENTFPAQYICEENGDPSWWQNFVDRVSGIFADHASGNVYLVTNSMDGLQRDCSTFIRVEQPTLVGRYFTQITFVNAHDFNDQRVYSLLNSASLAKRDGLNETLDPLRKRNSIDIAGYYPNWEGYGDDPNGNCKAKEAGPSYSTGNCGVHIVQYRATNEGLGLIIPDWPFNITLKDSNTEIIGGNNIDILGGGTYDLPSALPLTFEISPRLNGYGDLDPITLAYGGWSALSELPACSVGGYDNGYRQIDCGFPCA